MCSLCKARLQLRSLAKRVLATSSKRHWLEKMEKDSITQAIKNVFFGERERAEQV